MRALLFGLASVSAFAPAVAAPVESPWREGTLTELADWVFEQEGVRVSNCHLKIFSRAGAAYDAMPACYVFNKTGRPIDVRVQFVVTGRDGADVISTTLTFPGPIADFLGQELLQSIPFSEDERARIAGGKLRVRALIR